MSNKPVEGLVDRFLSICLTFAVAVVVLQWAITRLMPLLPLLVLGALVVAFIRWQRR